MLFILQVSILSEQIEFCVDFVNNFVYFIFSVFRIQSSLKDEFQGHFVIQPRLFSIHKFRIRSHLKIVLYASSLKMEKESTVLTLGRILENHPPITASFFYICME